MQRLADGSIRVHLAAPPVDGAANGALLRFLAEALAVPRTRIAIVGGATSRRKRIAVDGIDVAQLDVRLQAALARQS